MSISALLILVGVGATIGSDADPRDSLRVYSRDAAAFTSAAASASSTIDFDSITPGADISGRSIAGVRFERTGAALYVVRAADTLTPDGFAGIDRSIDYRLQATSGDNVLSPGGATLGPGPDPDIEEDNLTIVFERPVRAFGFDHLSQQADALGYTHICIIGTDGRELLCSSVGISYSGADPGHLDGRPEPRFGKWGAWGAAGPAADFWGVVSDTANIRAVIITEHDSDDQNPDCNIGFDTLRFVYGPTTSDWNQDGSIDPSDIADYLNAFFAGDADFDGSGATESADFFAFLSAFLSSE